ncbi:MAG: hypothetical protein MJE12_05075, partial [Alphaproteobacteria bacterium]|nr:hypothetical protein [Alphaproteobacteria bacterium]
MPDARNAEAALGPWERWNYGVLLSHATAEASGWHLAGPGLVLPFLYVALDAPLIFAALLLPLLQAAQFVSNTASAPFVSRSGNSKTYLAASRVMMTAALMLIALSAVGASPGMIAVIFLSAALLFGASEGFGNLAYKNLMSRVLGASQRSTMVYTEMALAGVLAVAIASSGRYLLDFSDPFSSHIYLLWAGIVGFGLSGLFVVLVRDRLSSGTAAADAGSAAAPRADEGYWQQLRHGFAAAGTMPWFKRYLVTRFLLLSVELAIPFYAIQAALLHGSKAHSLSLMVIASGVSYFVAGPIWRRVSKRSNRAVMALGAALAAAGGLLAIGIDTFPWAQSPYLHAAVIFVLMIAIAGVTEARNLYLIDVAPEAKQTYCFSLAGMLGRLGGVFVAFVFGYLAHIQHVIWPIY